jgi:hypothetical protein
MRWTRYSLVYLASYLSVTGAAFLLVPRLALGLLFATGTYDAAFVRFVGAFMIALATLVVQMIRHRLEVLYATTIGVRAFFLVVITVLYFETRDRLFLMIFAVVAVGVFLTGLSHGIDARGARAQLGPARRQ